MRGWLISGFSLQRTYRMPKEIRVEPQKFAAELIHRLEAVQRTREAEEKLEERLKRVRMVSRPESGMPCPSRFLSYSITASGPEGLPPGSSRAPFSVLDHSLAPDMLWPISVAGQGMCPCVTFPISSPPHLDASLGCVPRKTSLGGAPSLSLGSNRWGSCSSFLWEGS